jgi:NAD(P)-dependent dehydrogenase (short-subunit alcohol dehydrogenase family)
MKSSARKAASRLASGARKSSNGNSRAKKTTKAADQKSSAKVVGFPGRRASGPMREPESPMPKQSQKKPGIEARIKPRPRYEAPRYSPAAKLLDKVALITGGDSGIGRAVANLFAAEGADVAVVYLPQEQQDAEETRETIESSGRRALLIPGDVTDPKFCRSAVEKTVKEFGQLDVLVNNAAYQQSIESIDELSDEQWEHTFRTNIFGYFYMAKAALEHMKPGSAIINTGSITGLRGSQHLLDYASTKGAIHAFTKSLAQQLNEKKIRVNCIAPGPVWTPLNVADGEPQEVAEFGSDTPFGRPAQPEEIAPSYVFFASEADSSYITGEVLTLLGGETTAA